MAAPTSTAPPCGSAWMSPGWRARRPAAACTTAGGWRRWAATCCCGGARRFGGEGRVEFGQGPRYDLTLKALRIDLAEFARHNAFGADAQVKGLASAAVHLAGEGGDVSGLKGDGRIDVPDGKLYRLPLQLDL